MSYTLERSATHVPLPSAVTLILGALQSPETHTLVDEAAVPRTTSVTGLTSVIEMSLTVCVFKTTPSDTVTSQPGATPGNGPLKKPSGSPGLECV
jgi:hypothetical protein